MSYWRCCWLSVPVCISLISVASATGEGACIARPWNATKCCDNRAEIGAVTEGSLSVVECSVSAANGANVSLRWQHQTLEEDGESLKRIFLFSHCINPTNTSMAPSLSSLLYSADRAHLNSSTTVTQPLVSACSYFGCYEGCYGACLHTFSVVSCSSAPSTDGTFSSTMPRVTHTTELGLEISISPTPLSHQTSHLDTRPSLTVSPLPILMSPATTQPSDIVSTTTVAVAATTVVPFQNSPAIGDINTGPVHMWQWLVPLLLVALLTITTVIGILFAISCTSQSRNVSKDLKNALWHGDLQTTSRPTVKYKPWTTFMEIDLLSVHSVHTLYEDIDSTALARVDTDVPLQPSPLPPHVPSDQNPHDTTPPDDVIDGNSQSSSSGVSMCSYIETHSESGTSCSCAATSNDSGTSSYIADDSLNIPGCLSRTDQASRNSSSDTPCV